MTAPLAQHQRDTAKGTRSLRHPQLTELYTQYRERHSQEAIQPLATNTNEPPPTTATEPLAQYQQTGGGQTTTRTCTAMTATSRKHWCLRLLPEYHLLSQWSVSIKRKSKGRSMHADFTNASFVTNSHQRFSASFVPRDELRCSLVAPMSGGSSSDWWDGWEWRGAWTDSSSPDHTPVTQTTDEQTVNAVHKLRDRLKQMTDMTKKGSHKIETERATSTSKGNDAYAAMEAVIKARAQQEEAKRAYDTKFAEAAVAEEAYHDAIKRTLEKTEVLERHVKTVTMRADSSAFVEADFFPNAHRAPGRNHPGTQLPLRSSLSAPLPITTTRHRALHCPKLVPPQREG